MDKENMQQRIDNYVKVFNDLKVRTGDERTALTILQEVNKDIRMAQIRAERENGSSSDEDEEVTNRQRAYLKRLGVEIPTGLTKKQASAMIDEAVGKE